MATINGTPGNDQRITVGSNDELLGLEGNDILDAGDGKGNNTLRGGAGDDELFAYSNDQLFGDAGDDDLYSDGEGNNTLDGGEGNDEIFPDRNDTVDGGIGDDIIFAGRGGNTFTGGLGKDVFWIANVELPENPNTITDFNFAEDTIRVDLAGVENFNDLSITQQGNDSIITALGTQLVTVSGVVPSQLNPQNVVVDKNAPDNPGLDKPVIEDATFSIREHSVEETLIGTVSANDSDKNDILIYNITDGNLDIDGDGNTAFTIDGTSGEIIVNDSDDLDFEKNPIFNLLVTVADNSSFSQNANITINLQDEPLPEFDIEQSKQGIFSLIGDTQEKANILFSLVGTDADNISELGVFIVDENNAVNGITPDSPEYIQEALQQSKVIFSAINNQPNGYAELEKTRILEGYQSGERLVFYLVTNSTTDNVISDETSPNNVLLSSTFSSSDFAQVKIADMGNGKFELAWEDQIGGGDRDFNDLVLNLEITNQSAPNGTSQAGNTAELIDLRQFAGETVTVTAEVFREAKFDNEVVFYRLDNPDGIIDSLNPNRDRDYLNAALENLVKDTNGEVFTLKADNQSTASITADIIAESIFAPMMIVNGNLQQLQDNDTSNDPTVYFPYIGANSDGVDHIRLLGDNIFGFEDLRNGGDMDFNDMVVKIAVE
ncbi:DUF4114 domain-containing protein [Plectonema cf. radiosum LEGE 06105]|uniref:DUF4114 domain-containing protein n=1 Tax=Plectonema cf. radiosum LEGE 06105 TaxID=945769 RepID=A0A8J7F1A4_9CYAN|nr:DUF4114 domain-containing protein [Plectonema radiosum]MBE9212790.1 DUF4114 domain-containing protein [Plectonema cf. radiosum LEGE 06105]